MEIFGFVMCIIMGFFCYMSCHLNEERRQGKRIPLFWEKKD